MNGYGDKNTKAVVPTAQKGINMAENKTQEAKPAVTRAEKKDAAKRLIRDLLKQTNFKSNDLIDEAAKRFAQQFGGEETPNDVKGRIGSVIDVMKKEGEIVNDGGMYALKSEILPTETVTGTEDKPKKRTRKAKAKTEETPVAEEKSTAEELPKEIKKEKEETPKKAKRTTKKTKAVKEEKETAPVPPAPLQPIAPVAPVTPEIAPEPIPQDKPKKRGRKAKAKTEETPVAASTEMETMTATEKTEVAPQTETVKEVAKEEVKEEAKATETPVPVQPVVAEEKQPEQPKALVDMSFLFGDVKPTRKELPKKEEPKQLPKKEQPKQLAEKAESRVTEREEKPQLAEQKPEQKTEPQAEKKPEQKRAEPRKNGNTSANANAKRTASKTSEKALTADEKLQEAFLKRLRRLGGDYFEYYSVYLLERYSRMNGRRLESLRITGGDHDGGIDGEIELTDRLGFRETIYIQAKNWNPDKGDERLWVVGETLLQQFIGACVCRQAKDGKQHCRGIFITTSRFTPEARKILDDTSDKFVGYDGTDLYEAAKECAFGLVKKNGEWTLDEELLSGEKAFFRMY